MKNEESSGWTLETIPVLDAWREEIGRKPPPALPRVVRQLLRPVEHHEAARLVVDHPGKVFGGFSVEQVVEGVRKLGQSGYRPSPENLIRLTAGLMKPREDGGNVARLMTFDEAAVEARKYGFGDRWQQVFPLVHGSPDGKARWVKPHEAELLPEGYSLAEPHNTDAPKNGTKR